MGKILTIKTYKRILMVGLAAVVVFPFFAAKAQQQPESLTPVNCFDYYNFGSVTVDMSPEISSVMAGSQIRFFATTTNNNDYPIVDGSLYVKIFQKQTDPQSAQKNGGFLVDQFFAREGISLDAREGRKMDFLWTAPGWLPAGNYTIFAYFQEARKLNLLGLPFTDDVAGGRADFYVGGQFKKSVWIDKNNVKLNDKPYQFINPPPRFKTDEAVTATLPLKNPTSDKQTVTVSYSLYFWDAGVNTQRIDTKEETVTLAGGETKTISYKTTDSRYPVYFLAVQSKWHDFSSIADIRFVREGINRARINFEGVKNFPIKKGEANTLFVCAHNTAPDDASFYETPIATSSQDKNTGGVGVKGKIELSILDGQDNIIKQYSYLGSITGAITGFKADFIPDKDLDIFRIKTSLFDEESKLVDEVVLNYNCKGINETKCLQGAVLPPNGGEFKTPRPNIDPLYAFIGAGVVVLGIVVAVIMKKKKRGGTPPPTDQGGIGQSISQSAGTTTMTLVVLFAALFSFGALKAEAKSVMFSYIYPGLLGAIRDNGVYNIYSNPYYSVTYKAKAVSSGGAVLSDGDTVPVGSSVTFSYDLNDFQVTGSDTAFWAGTGGTYDTPYGHWRTNAAYPYSNLYTCTGYDFFWGQSKLYLYLPFSVNPPPITIDTSLAESNGILSGCSGTKPARTCTVAAAGNFSASVKFGATYARQYQNAAIWGTCKYSSSLLTSWTYDSGTGKWSGVDFRLDIPEKVISFQLKAGAAAEPASLGVPIINGPSTGFTGKNYSYTVFSTSSDAIENIRYEFNWGDGTPNYVTPYGGKINPGTGSHVWATAGIKTIQVRAQDQKTGMFSEWGQYKVSIEVIPGGAYLAVPIIGGPTSGRINTSYTFTANSSSTGITDIKYWFDWNGDGNGDAWSPIVPPGTSGSATNPINTWPVPGVQTFKVQAWGKNGATAVSTNWAPHSIVLSDTVIGVPVISGPTSGKIGVSYSFDAISSSTGNVDLIYGFDWGNTGAGTDVPDGIVDGAWTSPYSPLPGTASKLWTTNGVKTFNVKAKDAQGNESPWGSFTITIGDNAACTPSAFWTPCTVTCGPGGTQSRLELLNDCTLQTIETRTCNSRSCGSIIREINPGGP